MRSPNSMRAFIAIDITDPIRDRIRALIDELKIIEGRIRWSRPEGVHITLKFLGNLQPAKIDAVKACLSAIPGAAPFTVSIAGSGFFPGERSPHVIWLG